MTKSILSRDFSGDIEELSNSISALEQGLSNDETISGIKTFSSSPLVPTLASNDNSMKAASTAFVQAKLDTVGYVVDEQYSNTYGYREWSNGFIEQWAYKSTSTTINTWTFPIAFTSIPFVQATGCYSTSSDVSRSVVVTGRSTTYVQFSIGSNWDGCFLYAFGK